MLYGVQPIELYIDPGEAYVYTCQQLDEIQSALADHFSACQKKTGSNVAENQLHYKLLLRHMNDL